MTDTPIDLSGLRDIHLPIKPDFWPLATGWWVTIAGGIVLLIAVIVLFRIWHDLPVVYAVRKLKKINNDKNNDLAYLKEVSALLKRVAIKAYGRPAVAPLSDQTWQDFLLQSAPYTLTQAQAHLLAFAIYEPLPRKPIDRALLTKNAESWIKKVLKNKKSS